MAGTPAFDLDAMTAEELTALIRVAETKRDEKRDEAKAALLTEMRQKAEALGLSLEDLAPAPSPRPGRTRKARSDAGKPVAARYRGPKGEEWSGRGRPPGWLAEAEKEGRNRDEFRI